MLLLQTQTKYNLLEIAGITTLLGVYFLLLKQYFAKTCTAFLYSDIIPLGQGYPNITDYTHKYTKR